MYNWHPLQLKKSKSWEPFGSYQLNSTANPAHLPQNRPNFEMNGLDWQCCLDGSSKTVPRIFIFSSTDFFNCPGCRILTLFEIHCYLCPRIFGYNNSVLARVTTSWQFLTHFLLVVGRHNNSVLIVDVTSIL